VPNATQLDPRFWQIGLIIGDGNGDGPPIPPGRQIGDGGGDEPPILGKSGMGTPIPDPRKIEDGDGDGDRGFRALR
jgi:hypothetical protein